MRTGDTVVVPTRRTWIRCGISEPVTKTSRSETFSSCFEVWLAGVPATEEVTDRRNRDAITNNISVFMATKYTERASSAISTILPNATWSAAANGGSYDAGLLQGLSAGSSKSSPGCRFIVEGGTRTRLAGLPRANPRTNPSRSTQFSRQPALPLCPRCRLSNKDKSAERSY